MGTNTLPRKRPPNQHAPVVVIQPARRKRMSAANPLPTGSDLDLRRQSKEPPSPPALPGMWTATVLLSPFGDSISPLTNYSQLVVGTIECCSAPSESWMRASLYLTQDRSYFDFMFVNFTDSEQS